MSEDGEDLCRLKRAAEDLGKYFDSVQIFTTRYEPDNGTVSVNWGSGNWFSRFGQIQRWLAKEDEANRVAVRRDNE